MEERKLTEKESLELISQMIQNSRKNVDYAAGNPALLWGYVTVITSLLVYGSWQLTHSHLVMWLWFLIPIAGGIGMFIASRNKPKLVKTHLDKVLNAVWTVLGCSCMLLMLPAYLLPGGFPIMFAIALLVSQAITITGWVVSYKPYMIGGIIGIALSFLCLMVKGVDQCLIFAVIFIIAEIIPGHMLNNEMKRKKG